MQIQTKRREINSVKTTIYANNFSFHLVLQLSQLAHMTNLDIGLLIKRFNRPCPNDPVSFEVHWPNFAKIVEL